MGALKGWFSTLWMAICLALLLAGVAHARQSPDGLETVRVSDLPREAQQTLILIRKGGPFPYRRDGVTFQNRERNLPPRPRGHYREYTVPTPGARDRGARRIISGQAAEFYYTQDHYRSFRRIID